MAGQLDLESGLVDSTITLCKRSVDTCRRRNIAGEKIPSSIVNAMSSLSVLVYNFTEVDDKSEPYIE